MHVRPNLTSLWTVVVQGARSNIPTLPQAASDTPTYLQVLNSKRADAHDGNKSAEWPELFVVVVIEFIHGGGGVYSFTGRRNGLHMFYGREDYYTNLITLVPRPTNVNVVRCMWLFRHKYLVDVTLKRYKARLVANGSTQIEGVDVDEIFNPVVKLGISVTRDSSGVFLSQHKYATEILEQAHMVGCNSSRTHVDTESKLGDDVQQICLYMHDPREPHFSALKRILRYVRGTLDYELQLFSSSTTSLVAQLGNLLRELHIPLSSAMLVYCDNVTVVYLSSNPVQHQRTKHIDIDIHFVRELVAAGQVRVLHIPSRYQYAHIFTKGLPSALFEEFRTGLSVWCPPAQTAGEC
ncbi:ribonuclease H-like domain-containing protein [Tanacetum coccineum]